MPAALDPKVRAEARRLRARGASLTEIMRELGISYGSAHRYTQDLCQEKKRPPELAERIRATKHERHEEYARDVSRGPCGTPGCEDPDCSIAPGCCHCACGEPAGVAPHSNKTQQLVRGEPYLYAKGHKGTLMAADRGEPLAEAIDRAGLTWKQVAEAAGLGKGTVADLIGLEGSRLHQRRCEEIVRVLRDELEGRGLDTSGVTLERLFTTGSPAGESPGRRPSHRKKRQRPALPHDQRYDGRHFKEAREEAARLIEREGLWTRAQAAAFLGVSEATVTHRYNRARFAKAPRIVKVGPLQYTLYDPSVVKRLARDERQSENAWPTHFRDPEFVYEWSRDHGASAARARELADRARKRNREHARLRAGSQAGRPRADERRERLRAYAAEVRRDFAPAGESEFLGWVALLNWQRMRSDFPSDWPSAPDDPESFHPSLRQNAIENVRYLLGSDVKKLLQIVPSKFV